MDTKELKEIQEKISGYTRKGWKVEATDDVEYHGFYFMSPRGYHYSDKKLLLNVCNICEDDLEGCSGLHSDEFYAEEEEASRLCRLVKSLPFPNEAYLPEIKQ